MVRWAVFCLLAAAGVAAAAPGVAGAATVTVADGTLTYAAAPGLVNRVELSEPVTGRVLVVRQSGDTDAFGTTNCTVVDAAQVFCDGVGRILADMGDGGDTLSGSAVADIPVSVSGGTGSDSLAGGGGADSLSGGDGDDALSGNGGGDTFSGGSGIDRVVYNRSVPLTIALDGVANDGAPGENDLVGSDIEDVDATTAAASAVTLIGDAGGNFLNVDGGTGAITGGPGSDILYGGPQDDAIDARDGFSDRVVCGDGNDTAIVDPLDVVAGNCENPQLAPVIGGADDRPPTIAWSSAAATAALGVAGTTLAVTASDDHGIAKVEFKAAERTLCTVTAPPYRCAYRPTTDEVGRDTLIAIATDTGDQATSISQTVKVSRLAPKSLTLSLKPRRDRTAPYKFTAHGKLNLRSGVMAKDCAGGHVTVSVRVGKRTVAMRTATLTKSCKYSRKMTFSMRVGNRLRFRAQYTGNAVLAPRNARGVTARTT